MRNLKVVPFTGNNIQDIPARLRSLADLLDQANGAEGSPELENTRTFIWVNVSTSGIVDVGSFGQCHNHYHAVGILHDAAAQLLANGD